MKRFSEVVRRLLRSRSSRATLWSVANVIIATVIGVITARLLGASLRGTLAIVLSVAGLATLVGTLGTNVAIRRKLPRGEASVRGYLLVSAILFAPYVVLVAALLVTLSIVIDPLLAHPPVVAAFIVYAAAFFWSNQLLDLLNAVGAVPLSAATNASGTLICLVGLWVAAATGGGFTAVLAAYAFSVCGQIIVAILFLRPRIPRVSSARDQGGMVRDGVRLLGLNLGQALAYRADTLLIGALSSTYMAGIYAVAVAPAGLLRLPSTATGQVILHDSASGRANARGVWRRIGQIELALLVCAGAGWLLADPAVLLLFGTQYAEAAGVLRILLIAELALAPFLVLSRALVGVGGTWSASIPGISGAVLLVLLGVVLIPTHGAYGGAWASVAAYSLMSVIAGERFRRATRAKEQ